MKGMIRFFGVGLAVMAVAALPGSAGALSYSYSWTDSGTYGPSFGGDNPITYTLTLTETGPGIYSGTFVVSTNPIPGFTPSQSWAATWFSWKLNPNSAAVITGVSGGWNPAAFQSNFVGISAGTPISLTSGDDYTFTFTVSGLESISELISFQAGFTNGSKTDRLSQSVPVPEPNTLILLGGGLLALGVACKRFRKTKP